MSGRLFETNLEGPLAADLPERPTEGLTFYWLGQAGFIVDIAGIRIVIDPYLSDSLAEKYRGTPRPHVRMMPPPVAPSDIGHIDYVLCTHAHTDHMDPGTLPGLLEANPTARLLVPRATRNLALDRSKVEGARLLTIDAGERVQLSPKLALTATRAAHENVERDPEGNHRFLGYFLAGPAGRIWHSGDCVPFDDLVEEVRRLEPDIALMPVNGRRPELSDNGVPGNFTLDEAITVACEVGASDLVAHHYGLFDFNTLAPEAIDATAEATSAIRLTRAREAIAFQWSAT